MLHDFVSRCEPPAADVPEAERDDMVARTARSVAARFGRGNVAAQMGRILTRERMEQEREEVRRTLSGR